MRQSISLFVAAVAVFAAQQASAFNTYRGNIPNGSTLSCIACHATAAGGDPIAGPGWNSFGHDILRQDPDVTEEDIASDNENLNYNGTTPTWDANLCGADSDGDGQTNGQELGDPECVWERNAPFPRRTDISNPGDESDTSPRPTETDPPLGGEGEGEGEGEGDAPPPPPPPPGCCALTTSPSASPAATAPFLALLAVLVVRRRRR